MRLEVMGFPCDTQPHPYRYCENSYAVHEEDAAGLRQEITCLLAEPGIFCCGRFAE
jgi:hypothetical protein